MLFLSHHAVTTERVNDEDLSRGAWIVLVIVLGVVVVIIIAVVLYIRQRQQSSCKLR